METAVIRTLGALMFYTERNTDDLRFMMKRSKKLGMTVALAGIATTAIFIWQECQIKKLEDQLYFLNHKLEKLRKSEEE